MAHQVCQFHIIAELTKSVLRAVAQTRKALKARMPALPPGEARKGLAAARRPSPQPRANDRDATRSPGSRLAGLLCNDATVS